MNKAELIDAITDTVGDKRTATAAVEAVLATVQRTVAEGGKVSVPGFGVFEKVDRAARAARNPSTGEAVQLEATSVPRFRPGQKFKDVVRGAAEAPELPAAVSAPSGRATSRAGAARSAVVPDDVPGVVDEDAGAAPAAAAPAPGAAAVPSAAPSAEPEARATGKGAAKGGPGDAKGKDKAADSKGKGKAAKGKSDAKSDGKGKGGSGSGSKAKAKSGKK